MKCGAAQSMDVDCVQRVRSTAVHGVCERHVRRACALCMRAMPALCTFVRFESESMRHLVQIKERRIELGLQQAAVLVELQLSRLRFEQFGLHCVHLWSVFSPSTHRTDVQCVQQ